MGEEAIITNYDEERNDYIITPMPKLTAMGPNPKNQKLTNGD